MLRLIQRIKQFCVKNQVPQAKVNAVKLFGFKQKKNMDRQDIFDCLDNCDEVKKFLSKKFSLFDEFHAQL